MNPKMPAMKCHVIVEMPHLLHIEELTKFSESMIKWHVWQKITLEQEGGSKKQITTCMEKET